MRLRLCAIDGPHRHAIAAGVITTAVDESVPVRLAVLRGELHPARRELHPDVVVVERVFFQTTPARDVGRSSERGRALDSGGPPMTHG